MTVYIVTIYRGSWAGVQGVYDTAAAARRHEAWLRAEMGATELCDIQEWDVETDWRGYRTVVV